MACYSLNNFNGIKDNLIYTNDNTKGHFDEKGGLVTMKTNILIMILKEYGMSEITLGIPITSKQKEIML